MENLIQKYLKENNVEGKNGVDYRLEDSGNGIEIKGWTLQIEKPEFTQEESVLDEAKLVKASTLRNNRDIALNESIFTIQVNGVDCNFRLRTSDLASIQARISSLSDNSSTKSWSSIDRNRIQLNKTAFQSLFRDINTNDETVFDLYAEKLEEINQASSIEELNNININFE